MAIEGGYGNGFYIKRGGISGVKLPSLRLARNLMENESERSNYPASKPSGCHIAEYSMVVGEVGIARSGRMEGS